MRLIRTFIANGVNKMTKISSCTSIRSMIKAAGDDPIIPWINQLRSHFLPFLILKLKICNHFFHERDSIVVAHGRLSCIVSCLALGKHCKDLISLSYKKKKG